MSAGELIPYRGMTKADWEPIEQQAAPETLSGDADVLELGRGYWVVNFEFELPKREDFDAISAFLTRRQGAAVTFTAPRFFRKLPRDLSITSDAGLTVTGLSKSSRLVQFTGVGASKAYTGDMISYRTVADGYYIGQVQADVDPVGGAITMNVWPEPMTQHASTPSPRRIEALGEFRLDGLPKWSGEGRRKRVSFKAKQVIR